MMQKKNIMAFAQSISQGMLPNRFPVGLRSLAPDDPHYRPVYSGNGSERDSAYHQGTVWAWLLGPWLAALVSVNGQEGKATARKCFQELMPHLEDAGIGTVSEIFDADWPNAPRGCIARAWSVAEILRAYIEDFYDWSRDSK